MIHKLSIRNFRSFDKFDLTFDKNFVYIHGLNGCGKTSILESIYFCATTKSHRSNDEKEMIRHDEPFLQVKLVTDDDKYEIVLSKHGKRASINGVEKRKISDFFGHLRVVMFAPEDLDLIKGSPSVRRQFLDLEWMQLNKKYLRTLNTYKQILKQRNSLLKKLSLDSDYTFLNILGDQLYEVGTEIMVERKQFIDKLSIYFNEVYQNFSKHQVKIIYQPDVDEKAFKNHLLKQQRQDILYQSTLAGPHRDDFYIEFNGFDAKGYASQGEQRLIVVTLKLALLKLIENETKQKVILLLDDVLSELDQDKQQIFLENMPKEHQIIMNSAQPIEGDHIQMIYIPKE
ncbi:MAG: DNA replication/repair protein RecF [Acholeplasmataceae bacterium]|nr:DNA replication/repair protein RecF [Acholeplasmataceae bacterium]MDD4193837.1 DNA replication/repair protein RecF [Acholeplasmataceae bacterium]